MAEKTPTPKDAGGPIVDETLTPEERPLQTPRKPTVREWLEDLEARAAACETRAEASHLLLESNIANAERLLHGEALARLKRLMLDLYRRFWNPDPLA